MQNIEQEMTDMFSQTKKKWQICIVRKKKQICKHTTTLGINSAGTFGAMEHVAEHANPVKHYSLKTSLEAVETASNAQKLLLIILLCTHNQGVSLSLLYQNGSMILIKLKYKNYNEHI